MKTNVLKKQENFPLNENHQDVLLKVLMPYFKQLGISDEYIQLSIAKELDELSNIILDTYNRKTSSTILSKRCVR